jgi:hypothetical protein
MRENIAMVLPVLLSSPTGRKELYLWRSAEYGCRWNWGSCGAHVSVIANNDTGIVRWEAEMSRY